MDRVDSEELRDLLADLIECGALELICDASQKQKVYVPYMMNDAVEYYLIFHGCRIEGIKKTDFSEQTTVQMIQEANMNKLLFLEPDGTEVILWYETCESSLSFYQYHRIGHFWKAGQEQWRQLVYMVGTVFDKYAYLGEAFCNEQEKELLPLITFAPFRYWSPVKESLESKYPDTLAGILCMQKLAREAGDVEYEKMIRWYQRCFELRLPTRWMANRLAQRLNESARIPLYHLIFQKVCRASAQYPQRDYGDVQNGEIEEQRKKVEQVLRKKGYIGSYPHFQKNEIYILAAEEHPFTMRMLDYENFSFQIQLMLSKGRDGENAGFFAGNGSGRIVPFEKIESLEI